jgi:hypothetical protein
VAPGRWDGTRLANVRAFALVEVGHRQAIDVFVRREDADAELEEILGDEPDWMGPPVRRADRAR